MHILLIGRSSFLATAFFTEASPRFDIDAVSHGTDLASLDLDAYDAVVNFAYDPTYFRSPYDEAIDFDLRVAKALAGRRPHYFMMSTRKVYGASAPFPAPETAPLAATDFYGTNKAITEREVQRLLGTRVTILRIANAFGYEVGRHTFFGIALAHLRDHGSIVLDVSPFTRRDFLPADAFARILVSVLPIAPPGVYNLGSGQAVAIGQVALWIIEGFGSGELHISVPLERDSFLLDCAKLNTALRLLSPAVINVRESCLEIGRRLRNA